MQNRTWAPIAVASLLALPLPRGAFADGPCPADAPIAHASHGGDLLPLGNSRVDLEVVHDPSSGSFSVYAIQPTGSPVPLSAPVVIVSGTPTVEVTLDAIPGQPNAWRSVHEAFKSRDLSARMRVRAGGKDQEAVYARSSASVPVVPTSFVEASPQHGGTILSLCGSSFEWVHDPVMGKASLYAVDDGTAPISVDGAPTVSVRLAAGPRDLVLAAIPGQTKAWELRSDDLKGAALSGDLRVSIGGSPCQVPISGFKATHGGSLLTLGDGIARLEAVHDTGSGTLVLYSLDEPGRNVAFDAPPKLSFRTADGMRELALAPLDGRPGVWSVSDAALRAETIDGTVRVAIAGKPVEGSLAGLRVESGWAEPRNAEVLTFGDGVARLQMRIDPATGRLSFDSLGGGTPVVFDEAPLLMLKTDAGSRALRLERSGDGPWTTTAAETKNATSLDGTVRVRIAGQSYEATFHRSPKAKDGTPAPKGDENPGSGR